MRETGDFEEDVRVGLVIEKSFERTDPRKEHRGHLLKSILLDTTLAHLCTLIINRYFLWVVATRQQSSNGRPKSPRVQVVLPEDLCERLTSLANKESRTISNMAKVLIQEGVTRYEQSHMTSNNQSSSLDIPEGFRSALEAQQTKRLRGAPKRIRFYRPS